MRGDVLVLLAIGAVALMATQRAPAPAPKREEPPAPPAPPAPRDTVGDVVRDAVDVVQKIFDLFGDS